MLTNHRRALLYAAGLLVVTVFVFVLVGFDATRPTVQAVDDVVYRGTDDIRNAPLTVLARVLNVLGGGWVLIPLRIVVAAFLAVRCRWRALATWLLIWLAAEVALVGFKVWYARPRPPGPRVGPAGFSVPWGQGVPTAATAIALVLVLLPAGHHRRQWEVYAALFSFAMAMSRVYLNAHWFSDVVAGTLLGAGIALTVAGVVTEIRDVAIRRRERLALVGSRPVR